MAELYFRDSEGRILKGSVEPAEEGKLALRLPFSLKDELKASVSTPRWNPRDKVWMADDTFRTRFVLKFLQGTENCYARYDAPLMEVKAYREALYAHQLLMMRHMLTRRWAIVAAEMGTGKTLAAIETMEHARDMFGVTSWWYVAPKSALESVKYQMRSWKAQTVPMFMTYEEMVRRLTGWTPGEKPPQGIFYDESSRLKNAIAQRTQAAMHLADNIRGYYGEEGFIIEMSGSPAPKSPVDWWAQCEVAHPGFIREGSEAKFRDRIALMRMEENMSGIKYPKLITFRDSDKKCNVCGKLQDHEIHHLDNFAALTFVPAGQNPDQLPHKFTPMVNEIEIMHKRMNGLVLVQFKRDCLDLPEKIYQEEDLKPTQTMLRLAKMVKKSAPSAAQALILLRELSDGFQYSEKLVGTVPCSFCEGKGTEKRWDSERNVEVEETCVHCAGKKVKKQYESVTVECDTPKVQKLRDILESKEEDGRLIVFAGFTGSIDRVCATIVASKAGGRKWNWIRVDGRGWHSDLGISDPQRLIEIFQEKREEYPNVVFVGHPGSAGMGLTLTASDTIVYYSNDFNAESRIQSEDRIHRPGSRGANIVDLCHLPVDKLVLQNLKAKRDLMKITMGDLERALEDADAVAA
jgi:hypothetical protein